MAGNRQRRVNSIYQRTRPSSPDADEEPSERSRSNSRKSSVSPPATAREEEHVTPGTDEVAHGDEMEAAAGFASSTSSSIYLREPASLPPRPVPPHRRPQIRPEGENGWTIVESAGCHTRQVNGILSLLVWEHFPGLVEFDGKTEPAYTFDHYAVALDVEDLLGREFSNKAERVREELWDFFRCQAGFEDKAALVATRECKTLVKHLHYESRVQAIITYYRAHLGRKVTKKDAREMALTKEQYMVILCRCSVHPDCWEVIVDKWCSFEWKETHVACRERCLMMPGVAHHQGSRNLSGYKQTWSASHGGQECSNFMAYAMAHKGKATSDVSYNPEDPPSAYNNVTVYSRLSQYIEVAKEVHGPEYDPTTANLDGEVVMRVGGGKKHGRYLIGDSAIDMAAIPSLS